MSCARSKRGGGSAHGPERESAAQVIGGIGRIALLAQVPIFDLLCDLPVRVASRSRRRDGQRSALSQLVCVHSPRKLCSSSLVGQLQFVSAEGLWASVCLIGAKRARRVERKGGRGVFSLIIISASSSRALSLLLWLLFCATRNNRPCVLCAPAAPCRSLTEGAFRVDAQK